MKPIKITEKHKEALEAAATAANGKATAHTYNAAQIIARAEAAEAKLEKLGIPKADRVGAVANLASGEALPKAYKWARVITLARIERKSTGWVLTSISSTASSDKRGESLDLLLTPKQDQIAVAKFRAGYRVAVAAGSAA